MLKWSIEWNFVLFKLGNEHLKDKICIKQPYWGQKKFDAKKKQ
jgi:hypothetical protein